MNDMMYYISDWRFGQAVWQCGSVAKETEKIDAPMRNCLIFVVMTFVFYIDSGRKRIDVDEHLLKRVASDLAEHKISEAEAMQRVGISSRSTFYRRLKEIKNPKREGIDF